MSTFQGKLGGYKIIETEDGSLTYYSDFFAESAHSLSGAKAETLNHYAKACEILQNPEIHLLEVGFATGLGFLTTVDYLKSHNFKGILNFTSLEYDPILIDLFYENYGTQESAQFKLHILCGDARKTLKTYGGKPFNAIYQDPYSPRKNAFLWTREWFESLFELSDSECVMSTYCAATRARKSMLAAGWNLKEGIQFGRKRSATIAFKGRPGEEKLMKRIQNSSAQIITDENAPMLLDEKIKERIIHEFEK